MISAGPALRAYVHRAERAELAAEKARATALRRLEALMEARQNSSWRTRLTVARCAVHQAAVVHHSALRRHTLIVCTIFRLRWERDGSTRMR